MKKLLQINISILSLDLENQMAKVSVLLQTDDGKKKRVVGEIDVPVGSDLQLEFSGQTGIDLNLFPDDTQLN